MKRSVSVGSAPDVEAGDIPKREFGKTKEDARKRSTAPSCPRFAKRFLLRRSATRAPGKAPNGSWKPGSRA